MKSSIGDRIKDLRTEKALTLAQLAQIIGLSAPALSNYERNERSPDADTLIKLAKYFNVSADYLLCLTDTKDVEVKKEATTLAEQFIENISSLDGSKRFFEDVNSIFEADKAIEISPSIWHSLTIAIGFYAKAVLTVTSQLNSETCIIKNIIDCYRLLSIYNSLINGRFDSILTKLLEITLEHSKVLLSENDFDTIFSACEPYLTREKAFDHIKLVSVTHEIVKQKDGDGDGEHNATDE